MKAAISGTGQYFRMAPGGSGTTASMSSTPAQAPLTIARHNSMADSLLTLEADTAELVHIARLAGYNLPWNLFEATGRVWREERHSDTLAFLLSPAQRHGLGDTVALRLFAAAGIPTPA